MLLKFSKFFLYVAVFSIVIVMTSTFFPFIGGKGYFFRFAVELSLIFFVLWWAFEAGTGEAYGRLKKIFEKPIFIAVSLFVLAFLLASIFAYDPNAAFWSNFERGEGGFQILHLYAFFVMLVLLLKSEEDWRWLFKASLAAAILMILYGVFANLGLARNFISPYQSGVFPATLWERLVQARFQGSLGNPAYVAPYLLFALFYTAYLWAGSRLRKLWSKFVIYGGLTVAFLFFFMISQTRGGFLGLGAAVFVFLLYLIVAMPRLRKWLALSLVVVVLVGGSLVFYRQSDFVRGLPGGRIFDISFSEQTVNTRLWTWGSAWQGFKERPILGWGPENFSAVFDKYFDPRHFVPGKNTETWFDRAHSIYFDALAETGILGFLSYFGIFGVFYWQFFRRPRNDADRNADERRNVSVDRRRNLRGSVVQNALVFALPIGYLVQGIAIFDVLPIYINLFLFFAFANYYLRND